MHRLGAIDGPTVRPCSKGSMAVGASEGSILGDGEAKVMLQGHSPNNSTLGLCANSVR
jgi:hypothetical protein